MSYSVHPCVALNPLALLPFCSLNCSNSVLSCTNNTTIHVHARVLYKRKIVSTYDVGVITGSLGVFGVT